MKKALLIATVLLLGSNYGVAQASRYGVRIGANISSISSDDIADDFDTGRIGVVVGFFAEYAFNEKLSIQPEIQYSGQGNKEEDLRADYIQVPILFKYNFNHIFNIQLGPQAGIKIWEWEDNQNDNVDFNTFDYAVVGGIGVNITDNFFATARYSYGLANVFDDEDLGISLDGNNTVIQLSVGYRL
ncbi:hypothetical protein GCM10022393_17810 [Aquimarina addita]|uniref:Outer membrane protein beta-barrel domain-containing protein n=1 Tax=Aquimarina addita TaxID=870485 RepID=A0ABP6UJU1_9FLAO